MTVANQIVQEIDYTRQYKRWHSDTAEHIQQITNLYRLNLSEVLPLDKDISILDVGCGMGFAIMFLQDMGYTSVEGIEVDRGQVQSCLSKKLNVSHVENSIEFLQKKSGNYDLIVTLDVIEHLPHDSQLEFVRSLQTALKPGGKLICTVPNANSVLASRWRYIDWTHYTLFTEYSLDFLLFNAGFEDLEVRGIEYVHPPHFPSLLSRTFLKNWLWRIWFDRHFRESMLSYLSFKTVRFWQRMVMISELGWQTGMSLPISPNILATGVKPV